MHTQAILAIHLHMPTTTTQPNAKQTEPPSSPGYKAPRYMQMPTGYNDKVKHLISAPVHTFIPAGL
jgi:hypothetical protein